MNLLRHGIILIITSAAITASMLQLNELNIRIRIKELKIYLQKQDRSEDRSEHIKLITRYSVNSRLYENRISDEEADAIERRITEMAAGKNNYDTTASESNRYVTAAAVGYINVMRFLIGKYPLQDISESEITEYLHTAYFFERNNHYDRAVEYYNKTLNSPELDPALEAEIILHTGFCYAMQSRYKDAEKKYRTVLDEFGNDDAAVTAAILLRYLEGFRDEQNRVLKSESEGLAKGEKLFHLMAYDKTMDLLEQLKSDRPEDAERISFYIARTFEEQGRSSEAVEKFANLVLKNPSSRYARLSNRRLYNIGKKLENIDVMKISASLNNAINDPEFESITQGTNGRSAISPGREKIPVVISAGLSKRISDPESEKTRAPYARKKIKIVTTDGNTYIGNIVKQSEGSILLNTIIGNIEIKRDRISGLSPEK